MNTLSYNRYSRYLHWLMAFLIIFMVCLGWRFGDKDTLLFDRANLHKSIGILIFLLTFVRIALRLAYRAPPEPQMPKWQAIAAQALHFAFYAVMIGLPLSGWLMVSTSVREIPFFGLHWPHLPVPQTHDAHDALAAIHGLIAKILFFAMLPLHVLAALKHQFLDRDTVVEHMVPGLKPVPVLNYRWLLPVGVVGLAFALGYGVLRGVPFSQHTTPAARPPTIVNPPEASSATVSAAAEDSSSSAVSKTSVPDWTIDKTATSIDFETTFSGEPVRGGFGAYSATIVFDPQQLDKSHVRVIIDLASVDSHEDDRDGTLKSESFFDVANTPKAIFDAKNFVRTDDTHFIARGKLTMHGVTKPLSLPFELKINGSRATMSGTTTLDRTAFSVGTGEWAATDTIPGSVTVRIKLSADEVTH